MRSINELLFSKNVNKYNVDIDDDITSFPSSFKRKYNKK